jgi:hypothetical protein
MIAGLQALSQSPARASLEGQFPKFASVLKALQLERRRFDREDADVLHFLHQRAFRALVLVTDGDTAMALISFLRAGGFSPGR